MSVEVRLQLSVVEAGELAHDFWMLSFEKTKESAFYERVGDRKGYKNAREQQKFYAKMATILAMAHCPQEEIDEYIKKMEEENA